MKKNIDVTSEQSSKLAKIATEDKSGPDSDRSNGYIEPLKNENNEVEMKPINPMAFNPAFHHIVEQIFGHMDKKTLANCREVAKSWLKCTDNKNLFWIKTINEKNCEEILRWSCEYGHSEIAEIIFQKASKFNKLYATCDWNNKGDD